MAVVENMMLNVDKYKGCLMKLSLHGIQTIPLENVQVNEAIQM